MPTLPAPSFSVRKDSGLLNEYGTLAKFAAAIILNRWNKAKAVRPLLPMKRRQPRLVVARRKTIVDSLLGLGHPPPMTSTMASMRSITTARERTAHWTKIRRSRARFSGLAASCHMTWSAGFITSTSESNFSVRTRRTTAAP